MTDNEIPLGELLRELCERRDPVVLAERLGGVVAESPNGEAYFRLAPTSFPGISTIDVLPWATDHFGLATINLSSAWTRAEVERALGPLLQMPIDPGGPPFTVRYRATVDDPRFPARAVAYVTFADGDEENPGALVTSIVARLESMEEYR